MPDQKTCGHVEDVLGCPVCDELAGEGFLAALDDLYGPNEAELQHELSLLRQAAWGAARLADGGRPHQAANMLRSVLPDDYRPVGA